MELMTIRQILELTDSQMEALSEKEQRTVADVIGAVLDSKLRWGNTRLDDPATTLGDILQNFM
jgi:hypothetical protein